MKKAFVLTNGCPENRNDCARMENILKRNGWTIDKSYSDSSLILFNACGLTKSQEEDSIQTIEAIKASKRTDSKLIVWGCLPKINSQILKTVYSGPTFGSDEPEKISDLIRLQEGFNGTHANHILPHTSLAQNSVKHSFKRIHPLSFFRKLVQPAYNRYGQQVNLFTPNSFVIKTSSGCASNCTYCAVKISRGDVRSKPVKALVTEFKQGLDRGFSEFSLIGTDVGSYGIDRGQMLSDMLDELTQIEGEYQIRIRNINPKFLIPMTSDLKRILKTGKISYIGMAAQSGSDKILKSMQRGYKVEAYKNAVCELKSAYPRVKIRTQIMVGFPGETEEDFKGTLKIIDDIDFDFVETFCFQSRLGTKAADMPNQVPDLTAKNRMDRLFLKIVTQPAMQRRMGLAGIHRKLSSLLNSAYLN